MGFKEGVRNFFANPRRPFSSEQLEKLKRIENEYRSYQVGIFGRGSGRFPSEVIIKLKEIPIGRGFRGELIRFTPSKDLVPTENLKAEKILDRIEQVCKE